MIITARWDYIDNIIADQPGRRKHQNLSGVTSKARAWNAPEKDVDTLEHTQRQTAQWIEGDNRSKPM